MNRLTRDGTAGPVSRDKNFRRERGQGIIQRGQGIIHFPSSADHEQDWQPCPVDPYSCYMCDHIYIHSDYHEIPDPNSRLSLGPQFCRCCLKKNQNAPRPSEHPPVGGKNVETFRWDHRLHIQNLFMAFKRVPLW